MKKRTTNPEDYWRKHVEACNAYKGHRTTYCKANGLKASRLYYWEKKLKMKQKSSHTKSKAFVEAKIIEDYPKIDFPLKISLSNGIELCFSANPSSDWLAHFISCIGGSQNDRG